MKIGIINGSPKPGESNSGIMIEYISSLIGGQEITIYNIGKVGLTEEQFAEISKSDVLIFSFPLYVDGIPSHLFRLLADFEKRIVFNKNTMVYCIVNNGFFEGKQNRIAIDQMKNWCVAVGLKWGQAIGIGAGEMQPFIKDIPLGYGPNKNIGNALKEMACNIENFESGNDIFISPNWPRFLWRIQASLSVWYPRARKNGLKRRELFG